MCLGLCISCDNNKSKPPNIESPKNQKTFAALDTSRSQRISTYFDSLYSLGKFNGSFLFRHDSGLVSGAFGFENYELKTELSDSTRFQLASVSKPFTAMAFMRLVENGVLDLDKDVRDYLPDFPYEGINCGMLLCHKSGLPNYMYLTDSMVLYAHVPDSLSPNEKMLLAGQRAGKEALSHELLYREVFLKKPALYALPNKRFSYCNTNYFLLAYIMEKRTSKNIKELMDSLVFEPLNMGQSFLYSGMKADTLVHTAIGYTARFRPYADFYLNGVLGDKGMYSNVHDLLIASLALEEDHFLSKSSKKMMFSKQAKTNKRGMHYGYGFRLKKYQKKQVIFHNGWWRGFRTYYLMIPEEKKTIIVLCNSTMGGFLNTEKLINLLD